MVSVLTGIVFTGIVFTGIVFTGIVFTGIAADAGRGLDRIAQTPM